MGGSRRATGRWACALLPADLLCKAFRCPALPAGSHLVVPTPAARLARAEELSQCTPSPWNARTAAALAPSAEAQAKSPAGAVLLAAGDRPNASTAMSAMACCVASMAAKAGLASARAPSAAASGGVIGGEPVAARGGGAIALRDDFTAIRRCCCGRLQGGAAPQGDGRRVCTVESASMSADGRLIPRSVAMGSKAGAERKEGRTAVCGRVNPGSLMTRWCPAGARDGCQKLPNALFRQGRFPASGRPSGRLLHQTSGIQALSKRPSGHFITTLELTKAFWTAPSPPRAPSAPRARRSPFTALC